MEGPVAGVAGWTTKVPALADDPTGAPVAILLLDLVQLQRKVGLLRPKSGQQLRLARAVLRVRVDVLLTSRGSGDLILQLP